MTAPMLRASTLLALLALGTSGCGKKGGAGGWGEMVVQVVGFAAERQPIEESVSLIGTLAANEAVEIMSELDGVVDEIAFQEGQPVAKGDVLVLIDQRKLRASVAEAEARTQLANSTMQRYLALAESKAVSQQEVDRAKSQHETDLANLTLVQAQLEDATITAPFDGLVGRRLVSAGQYVTRGQQLTSLVDTDPMKAEFHVPERYVSQIRPGQQVQLTVAAHPDAFTGEVYFVDPRIDESTRTVLVKALVPNTEGRLHSGMFANLRLVVQLRQDALVIPEAALMVQGEQTSVFAVDEANSVQPRPVTTGVRLAGMVEVLEGLRPGETVVVEGLQKLGPGAKVSVRFEDPAAAALPGGLTPTGR